MTDRRLVPVTAALAAGRLKVLSVDVFDTLLWRRVPEPRDAFLLLGRELKAAGKLAAHAGAITFAELRQGAEKAARELKEAATGSREIVLTDVYREIPPYAFAPGFDVDSAAAAEVALEARLMIRDRAVADVMRQAKAAGVRVILVSDTYFTSAQLKGFLAVAGVAEGRDYDTLYVSCEVGRPKWRDLFDVVLATERVAANQLLHIGDTLEADVWPCQMRGIAFAHYDKWGFSPRVQTIEWPKGLAERAQVLGARGDFGLTGLRSRLFHDTPADLDPALAPYWSYGAATLAPVFAAFGRWIVASCRAANVTKVYGIMREGRFLNSVIATCARDLGIPLATEELWLSRRAVIRAALSRETAGLLPEAAMLSPGHSTDEVLGELGLTTADLAVAGLPGFEITAGDALVKLCRVVGTTPHLMAKCIARAGEHRINLMTALARQFDLETSGPAVVVDLGYTATIQTVLQDMLARDGSPLRLIGLYLALNAKALENLRRGADLRGYLDNDGFGGDIGKLLTRVPFVLEHACMCAEGSLSHFDAAGEPVLLPNQRDPSQIAQMEALQAGILAGVARVNALLGDLAATPVDDPFLKTQVAAVIEAAHLHPTPQEATTIGAWKHEAKIDFTGAYKLTDLTYDRAGLEYRGWAALTDINLDEVYWPGAAFAAAEPFMGEVYAGGAKEAYQAQHLTSGPMLGRLTVCPDTGAGFDERLQGTMPLTMNVFGRTDLQATIKGLGPEAYYRLRIAWPKVRAVIALDRLVVTYVGEQERLIRTIAGDQAQWDAGIAENGVIRAEPDAVCTIALGPPPPWPHGIELSLRLKYLRLDPLFGAKS